MSYDTSEQIDDYCREKYGHSNWGYLSTYKKEELKKEPHTIEGGIVFWEKDVDVEEKEE